jgi:hypothetical protein
MKGETSPKPASSFIPAINGGAFWQRRVKKRIFLDFSLFFYNHFDGKIVKIFTKEETCPQYGIFPLEPKR